MLNSEHDMPTNMYLTHQMTTYYTLNNNNYKQKLSAFIKFNNVMYIVHADTAAQNI